MTQGIVFSGDAPEKIAVGVKTMTRRVMNPQPPAWVEKVGISMFSPDGCFSGRGTYEGERAEKHFGCPFLEVLRVGEVHVKEAWRTFLEVLRVGEVQHVQHVELYVKEAWRTLAEYDRMKPKELMSTELSTGRPAPIRYEASGQWVGLPSGYDPAVAEAGRYRNARFMPRAASRMRLAVTSIRVERVSDITEGDARREGCSPREGDGHRGYVGAVDVFRELWDGMHAEHGAGFDDDAWVWAVTFKVTELRS